MLYSMAWSLAFVISIMLILHGTLRNYEKRSEARLSELEERLMAEITETSEMEKEN